MDSIREIKLDGFSTEISIKSELRDVSNLIKKDVDNFNFNKELLNKAKVIGDKNLSNIDNNFIKTLQSYDIYYTNKRGSKLSKHDDKAHEYVEKLIDSIEILVNDGRIYYDLANELEEASKNAPGKGKADGFKRWGKEFYNCAIKDYSEAEDGIQNLLDSTNLPNLNESTLVKAFNDVNNEIKEVRDAKIKNSLRKN